MKPKVFEVDINSIEKRVKELDKKRKNFEEETEFNVLKCFNNLSYCLRNCTEFYSVDVFSRKSCMDCLRSYVKEVSE